jgi:type IV pilus assembly protein PilP
MTMAASARNLLLGLILILLSVAGCGNSSESEPPEKPVVLRKEITMPKEQTPQAVKPKEGAAVKPQMAEVPAKSAEEAQVAVEKTKETLSEAETATKPPLQQTKAEQPLPEKKPMTQRAEKSPELLAEQAEEQPAYRYDPEGKLDPFQPLFATEAPQRMAPSKKMGEKEKKEKRLPLTPLQRIDLGQLKLVGIILSHTGNKALVEEPSGKGYVISKGTYVGTHFGRVKKILNDRVIVEEQVEDFFSGGMKPQATELELQKRPGHE